MSKIPLLPNRKFLIGFLLGLILAAGAALRLYNPQWDLGTFPHPDERSTVQFYAPSIRFPDNRADWLNPRLSPLNPFWNVQTQERRSYTYGHFPLYLLVAGGHFLASLSPALAGLNAPPAWVDLLARANGDLGFAVLGRILTGLFDTLSVYLVFLIARRLYGNWAALLAAAFSAFAVFHIQLAHFFAVDPISATFVLLTVYASMLMVDRRSTGSAVLAGLAIGLAVSSKYSALPVALAPAVAAWFVWRSPAEVAPARARNPLAEAVYLLSIAGLVSFFVFAVTSPFVLLDYANFHQAVVEEQGRMVSGVADFPFTRQYRNTTAYLYFIEQQVRWGLGWPLGLVAFIGLGWAMVQAVRRKLPPAGWIILAWVVPYFGVTGLFLAKFMRYMSPVTPFAIIFGAGLIAAITRRFSRRGGLALAGLTLAATILWAAMFVNGVYGHEHSWITASRWIYAHVPDGACIAREHWEEGVPVNWSWAEPGMSAYYHGYAQPELPMYEPDTEEKYLTIRDTLKSCDYLIIASNRMSRTLPRLSQRYPFSTRYYQALFSGELGFEIAGQFASPPRLGPLALDDQPADESFTVYDHPKATLFKKVRNLSDEEWFAALGNSWQGAVAGYVGKPTLMMILRGGADVPQLSPAQKKDKSTALDKPLTQWPVVDDWQWNAPANQHWPVAALVWWLAAQAIGLIAFPPAFLLWRNLADGGWLLSKSLGLLLISYAVWLPAGLGLPANRLPVIWAAIILLALISLGVARRNWAELRETIRARRFFLLAGELVFSGVFLFFVCLRLANPDLWQPWNGGEKMLEIGFLHAVVKSATMPPYDPFFAGTYINYYYYGLFIVGVLVKLTGIMPVVAFNLAVPLLAALTAVNVFSLAGSLSRAGNSEWRIANDQLKLTADRRPLTADGQQITTGLLAVLTVLFFSNLDGMGQFLRNLAEISESEFTSVIPGLQTLIRGVIGFFRALGGVPIREYNFWDPSRVIPNTINEFPYWSFLFADLHPHMIGIPFTVLFLALVYAQMTNGHWTMPETGTRPRSLIIWLAAAFVLGALAIINTWDLPTYLGLWVAAYAIVCYRAKAVPLGGSDWVWLAIRVAGAALATLAAVFLLYQPFFAHYQATDVGLGLVKDKIPLDQFLKLWGFFLVVVLVWLWLELRRPQTRFGPLRALSLGVRRWNVLPHLTQIYRAVVVNAPGGYPAVIIGVGAALAVAAVLAALKFYTVALLCPWVIIAVLLLLRRETAPARIFVELLIFTGLLLLLGVQVVFLKDFLGGGDYYRMNTYFKFFIQVWVLFGLAAAVLLPPLWRGAAQWPWGWRWLWQSVVTVLIFSSLVFLILGTRTRLDNRFPDARPAERTLDGMAYMTVGQFNWDNVIYDLRPDYEAIRWMQAHIPGTPILAEAKIGYYREWGMRVSAYTGLPGVLGGLHQSEQHFPAELGERDGLVNRFWFAAHGSEALELANQLDIEYIYVGQVEQALYGAGLLDKFRELAQTGALEIVFENDRTVIYRVVKR